MVREAYTASMTDEKEYGAHIWIALAINIKRHMLSMAGVVWGPGVLDKYRVSCPKPGSCENYCINNDGSLFYCKLTYGLHEADLVIESEEDNLPESLEKFLMDYEFKPERVQMEFDFYSEK